MWERLSVCPLLRHFGDRQECLSYLRFDKHKASGVEYTITEASCMVTAKQEVESLLDKLPDDCSLEEVQYHLYVIEKVRNGREAAETQGTRTQQDAERQPGKWLTE